MKKIICLLVVLISLVTTISCNDETISSTSNNNKKSSDNDFIGSAKKIIYDTVSFETNGGTKVDDISSDKIEKAPSTTKENYEFDGWFLDSTFTTAAVFPLTINKDMTLYAKWLKIKDTNTYVDTKIKWDDDYSSSKYYQVTPSGFDFDRLQQKEYQRINITVTYSVYYKKDYNVLWDIGYAGSPKYEISLFHSNLTGQFQNDLTTKTSAQTRTISGSILISDIENDKMTLKFSTDNIQNIIYFENITINYECVK